MNQYAYYYEHGPVKYIVLTTFKSLDIGGQTVYVSNIHDARRQARLNNAERVNF